MRISHVACASQSVKTFNLIFFGIAKSFLPDPTQAVSFPSAPLSFPFNPALLDQFPPKQQSVSSRVDVCGALRKFTGAPRY